MMFHKTAVFILWEQMMIASCQKQITHFKPKDYKKLQKPDFF